MMRISEESITSRDPRDWSDEKKLEHSRLMVEKLGDRHPRIADAWRKSVGILEARIASRG